LATSVNYGLSAAQRLKTPAQYKSVYQSKQWGGSKYHTFNVLADQGENQLGVTVSKKVSKLAVDRNRIKRQIKDFYRHHQSDLRNTKLVITAKPSCNNANDHERLASLQELWTKVLKWQHWHDRQTQKPSNSDS